MSNSAQPDPRIADILARTLRVEPASIRPDSGPGSIASWDSAAHMAIVMDLERTFGVQFEDDQVADLVSPTAIADALKNLGADVA